MKNLDIYCVKFVVVHVYVLFFLSKVTECTWVVVTTNMNVRPNVRRSHSRMAYVWLLKAINRIENVYATIQSRAVITRLSCAWCLFWLQPIICKINKLEHIVFHQLVYILCILYLPTILCMYYRVLSSSAWPGLALSQTIFEIPLETHLAKMWTNSFVP